MANLNLSQFGENTSVSDADYTFVWDSANSISKKVSRNSWLNSGELTSSAPVTISQTWNGTSSTFFSALKVNVTTSGSSTTSLLLDLQVGGASYATISRIGGATFSGIVLGDSSRVALRDNGVTIGNAGAVQWSVSGTAGATRDLFLVRDAANTLALRNGAAAQTFNVYGTYTSITDYRRLTISCDNTTGNATITANKGSGTTGDVGTVSINGVPVGLGKGNVSNNIAIGTIALNANTSGAQAVAVGFQALALNTSGQNNTAVGSLACYSNTTGNRNCALGISALERNSTGSDNIAIGKYAGLWVTALASNSVTNNSIYIGTDTKAAASGETNQIVIGHAAQGIGSNSVVLGNDSIEKTALKGNVGIGTTSPTSKLHVAETWNNVGTAFCAIKSVITDTNSAAGSDFLELYSGTSTQPLRMDINKTGQINIYGTWTDASNYERLSFSAPTAGNAIIGTNRSGGTARGLEFQTDGVTRMTIDAAGSVKITGTFNTLSLNIGGTGTNSGFGDFSANAIAVWANGVVGALIGRGGGYSGMRIGSDGMYRFSDTVAPSSGVSAALALNAAGVVEVNNGTAAAFRDLRVRSVIEQPPASITPALNGDLVVEATSNTTLTFKLKGTDGTVRTGTITLA